MTTSVPQVRSLEDLKWQIAKLLEDSREVYRTTGDIDYFEQAVRLARCLYETKLKEAGNNGSMDWGYINKYQEAIERLELVICKIRKRQMLKVEPDAHQR